MALSVLLALPVPLVPQGQREVQDQWDQRVSTARLVLPVLPEQSGLKGSRGCKVLRVPECSATCLKHAGQ